MRPPPCLYNALTHCQYVTPALKPSLTINNQQTQVIIDPYAKGILSRRRYGELGPAHLDYKSDEVLGLAPTWPQAAAFLPKPGEDDFDWEGDTPLELPMEDLVIYEMHVRGECSSSWLLRCTEFAGMCNIDV
jgi:pullulanase/glycogen debranching enzyme